MNKLAWVTTLSVGMLVAASAGAQSVPFCDQPNEVDWDSGGYDVLNVAHADPGPAGWTQIGFDTDASYGQENWSVANGAIASENDSRHCASFGPFDSETVFPVNRDILVRHELAISAAAVQVRVDFQVDNEIVEARWNGRCLIGDQETDPSCLRKRDSIGNCQINADWITIPTASVQLGGTNILTVRARDVGVVAFYDHRIVVVGDDDNDGVTAAQDNCRNTENPDQNDRDGDGQGDACDCWPDDPTQDGDNDGLSADIDNCPFDFNPNQENGDGDVQGDLCDPCPELPGPCQLLPYETDMACDDDQWRFERTKGTVAWALDGMPQQLTSGDLPFRSEDCSLGFNDAATGATYSSGSQHSAGTAASPWIDARTDSEVWLTYWDYLDTEDTPGSMWDVRRIDVSDDDFETFSSLDPGHRAADLRKWTRRAIDLSEFAGTRFKMRFWFDTVDALYNNGHGWVIDDVSFADHSPEADACIDTEDNDGDGLHDCADPDCAGDAACLLVGLPYEEDFLDGANCEALGWSRVGLNAGASFDIDGSPFTGSEGTHGAPVNPCSLNYNVGTGGLYQLGGTDWGTSYAVSPVFDGTMPGTNGLRLSFWNRWDTNRTAFSLPERDIREVHVSYDGFETWTTFTPRHEVGDPDNDHNATIWMHETFELDEFAGSHFQVRFWFEACRGCSDVASEQQGFGWMIDQLEVATWGEERDEWNNCSDGLDNDGNGRADCLDPVCQSQCASRDMPFVDDFSCDKETAWTMVRQGGEYVSWFVAEPLAGTPVEGDCRLGFGYEFSLGASYAAASQQRVAGYALSPVIDPRQGGIVPELRYDNFWQIEDDATSDWDQRHVEYTVDGITWIEAPSLHVSGNEGVWFPVEQAMPNRQFPRFRPFQMRFRFDSGDGWYNDDVGWFIDDFAFASDPHQFECWASPTHHNGSPGCADADWCTYHPSCIEGWFCGDRDDNDDDGLVDCADPDCEGQCQALPHSDRLDCSGGDGWAFTVSSGDVSWAIDGTPASVVGSDPNGNSCNLNFNNGVDFASSDGDASAGQATSPIFAVDNYDGGALKLRYWDYYAAEVPGGGYDEMRLYIGTDEAGWTELDSGHDKYNRYDWVEREYDLHDWLVLGRDFRVRFEVDSVDDAHNDFAGWFISNLEVGP